MAHIAFKTPFGDITLFEDDGQIICLEWGQGAEPESSPILENARQQLIAFFSGQRTQFDLPLAPFGSDFDQKVWAALQDIPYGETRTYKQLAEQLGTSPRAIGGACGRNPIPIFIPCHRITHSNGTIGHYSGGDGSTTKANLLRLEGAAIK
jgi:methylated-DNA-[protein]-cysteine S-methyltransferase